MAKKPMPWFRFYVEAAADRKLRRMRPEHRWVWVACLCAARSSCEPGELWVAPGDPMTIDDLADMAGVPVKVAAAAVDHMLRLNLLAGSEPWTVPSWDHRQYKSDVSTERSRRSRERASNSDATLQQRSSDGGGNAPETEAETDPDVNPPTPLPIVPSVDNRTASHGHYPYDDRPAVTPAVAALHASNAAFVEGRSL
jgi:hypothetical protein